MPHEYDVWTKKVLDFLKKEMNENFTEQFINNDQRSLHDQLKDLMEISRVLKMYDARDFLNSIVNK